MKAGIAGIPNNLEPCYPHGKGSVSLCLFGPIRNERDYEHGQLAPMEYLLQEVGEDEDHGLADLLDVVSTLVGEYEDRKFPLDDARPRDVLKFLMEQHGLKQADLKKEIGSQGVVSEILAGDR